MSDSKEIKFPSKWDINNVGMKDFYEQCLPYVKETEDYYIISDVSIYFTIISILSITYIIIINIWLLYYHKSYMFKRQCVTYYVMLFIGCLFVSFDSVLIEVNIFFYLFIKYYLFR